jgi:hypothetical protein
MVRKLSRNMKNKSLVAFGSAAILFSVVQSAAATEKRDTRKVRSHHVSTSPEFPTPVSGPHTTKGDL